MITIRHASISDFKMLASLGRRAFQEAFGQYNDPGDMQAYLDLAFDPERIQNQLRDTSVIYLVADYQGEPVGYTKLVRDSTTDYVASSKQIQLERIYALDAYIGKKIGQTMMLFALELAQREGFDYMWLGVWQHNDRAIKFYKDFGFEIIGVKQFIIGEEVNEDYVMGRKV
jgi:ribosomal protein S18 acetylase RimI-like enzyme